MACIVHAIQHSYMLNISGMDEAQHVGIYAWFVIAWHRAMVDMYIIVDTDLHRDVTLIRLGKYIYV